MNWFQKLWGRSRSAPAQSAKPATLHRGPDGVYVLRISGILNKATVSKIQTIATREFVRGVGGLKILCILHDFRGWARGDDWGDIEFFAAHEDKITKIALVCDAEWETEAMVFLAAGHRTGEVRHFAPEDEAKAKAWLTA